jgi:6-phosphogluconolactonase (cycloisomerase 2 family)
MRTIRSGVLLLGMAAGGFLQLGIATAHEQASARAPVVYTETNAAGGNEILVFQGDESGNLSLSTRVATRGTGTDGGLGNQGALILSPGGNRLYAVNAGSNDISVFAVQGSGLTFLQKVPSGGTRPVSLTLHDNQLFALNAGDVGNISGFQVHHDGRLQALAGTTRLLSAAVVGPAQVQFDRDGELLVVTEKGTNKIDVYDVDDDEVSNAYVRASNGATPFGFAFDKRNHLIVSEAFGGAAGASALSSYDIDEASLPLELISGSIRTGQSAACWVVVTNNGRYAYTSNTGSGNISGYRVSHQGALSLLTTGGVTGVVGPGSGPTDLALGRNSRLLFSLNPPIGSIKVFSVQSDGSLIGGSSVGGVPNTATGLVVR